MMIVEWRKATRSGSTSNCVELGMVWRKASMSSSQTNCVEVAGTGLVRDSKNPSGPVLRVDLPRFVAAVKQLS